MRIPLIFNILIKLYKYPGIKVKVSNEILLQILPLENEMKTPKSFVGKFGVLNQAMISIIIMYIGMGLFGYLQYGDEAAGSITLNLPSSTET